MDETTRRRSALRPVQQSTSHEKSVTAKERKRPAPRVVSSTKRPALRIRPLNCADETQEGNMINSVQLPPKAPVKGAPEKLEGVLHDQHVFEDDDGCNTDTENSGEFSDENDEESFEDLDVAGHVVDPTVLNNIIAEVLEWIHESDNEVLKQYRKEFVEVLRDPSSFLRPYPSWDLRSTLYFRKWPITKRDLWLYLNAHPVQTDNLQSVKETLFLLLSCHLGTRKNELLGLTFADVRINTNQNTLLTVRSCKQNSIKRTAHLRKGWEEEIEDLVYVVKPDYTRFCPHRWLRHYLNLCSPPGATVLFSGISKQRISCIMDHMARFFGISRTKLSLRGFRHGYAVDKCLEKMKKDRETSTLSTMKACIINGRNWNTDRACSYLYYDLRSIEHTYELFMLALKENPHADPADYHVFVSRIGSTSNVVSSSSRLCQTITPLLGRLDAGWFVNSVIIALSEPFAGIPGEELPIEGSNLDDVYRPEGREPLDCCREALRGRRRSVHEPKTLRCEECNDETFYHDAGLKAHRRYVHEPKNLQCEECKDETFYNDAGLRAHRRHVHEPKNLQCEECNDETFYNATGLRNHRRYVHASKNLQCEECSNGTLYNATGLKAHRRYVHASKTLRCEECNDETFYNATGLRNHRRSVHEPKTLRCEECNDETFYNDAGLRAHRCSVHEPKNLQCEECSNGTLYNATGLREHRRSVHRPKTLRCEECSNDTLYNVVGLKNHRHKMH